MNGTRYFRLINGMSQDKLSEITGVSRPTLRKMEEAATPGSISASKYRNVANVLHIPPDKLIDTDFPDAKDGGPVRAFRPSRVDNKNNPISMYRAQSAMTYQRLADCLGLASRQRAHQLCCEDKPLTKYVEILAKHENISVENFINKYSINMKGEHYEKNN